MLFRYIVAPSVRKIRIIGFGAIARTAAQICEVERMSRYIDIEPYEKDGWYLQKRYHNSYGEAIKTTPLNCVPTAEPIKHGHWIKNPPTEAWEYHCSRCGTQEDYKENYCRNCGARMDEVEE